MQEQTASAFTINKTLATDSTKKVKPAINFPVLPANISRLFYVQRDPNTNTIVYELNEINGQLNTEEPVHVYWIKYNEKGQHEELNYIQRKFAYGLNQKPLGNDKYDIRFVSYKKYPLTLMKGADGKYHIYATIAHKQAILNRIFVKIEGGSFWLPNVVYVEVKGIDPATGQEIVDRFKP
ncbi:DUF4833 domain-containing protein [Mucilaginibacter sp. R11]|uniref:DUF4833 domain-containing protein n=1 Tax=Mucilaginibacter agri TaxID=2695265 RepID=A0A965ZJ22_9SPHI|nr:DUF4833 domain-containing protein [Mucilaginibacter agri]